MVHSTTVPKYNRQHCTLHTFGQFEALYMHNHDDEFSVQPEFEPGTSWLQAPVDTNEPSGQPLGFGNPALIKIIKITQTHREWRSLCKRRHQRMA